LRNKRQLYNVFTESDSYEEVQSTTFSEGKIFRTSLLTDSLQSTARNDLGRSKEDSQCTYKRNIEARSRNHCCRGKATNFTYFECLPQALVIQHAMRMRHVVCHLWPAPLYKVFVRYLINGTTF